MLYSILEIISLVVLVFLFFKGGAPSTHCRFLSCEYTNCLRGIAILLVVLCYTADAFGTRILTPLGGIGVAMFLFLSGYGLSESYKKYGLKCYWRKKLLRVFIPYFLLQSISALYLQHFEIIPFILDITGIKSEYWYISYLLQWYIIFYVLYKITSSLSIILMAIISFLILLFSSEIQAEQAFSFLFGVLASRYYTPINGFIAKKKGIIVLFFFLIGTSFLLIKQIPIIREYRGTYIYNLMQCFIKLPLAFVLIISLSYVTLIIKSRILLFFSLISYELYLVHMKFISMVDPNWKSIILFWVMSIFLSYLFYKYNSRISCSTFIKRCFFQNYYK